MLRLVLLILAVMCFALAAMEVHAPRINLQALGLFLLALVFVLESHT